MFRLSGISQNFSECRLAMLTKVVEPELGFLSLFTDSKSDESLASYDVSKFPLLIAVFPMYYFRYLKLVYDTARVVIRSTAKTGILKCASGRRWGSARWTPNLLLQKLAKMRKHLSTPTGGFWSQESKFFFLHKDAGNWQTIHFDVWLTMKNRILTSTYRPFYVRMESYCWARFGTVPKLFPWKWAQTIIKGEEFENRDPVISFRGNHSDTNRALFMNKTTSAFIIIFFKYKTPLNGY